MGECKTKAIQTYLGHSGIIRHIQELFRHIQSYLESCVTLTYWKLWYFQNPDIFRTRSIFRTTTYSQLWCIENPAIFRTLAFSKSEAHSEPCRTSTMKRQLFSQIIIIFAKLAALKQISWGSFSRGSYTM